MPVICDALWNSAPWIVTSNGKDMARITVEDCLREENNRFALVQLAAKRTKQLLHGSRPVIEDPRGNKSVVMALREIASGKVRFMNEDELREAEAREAEEAKLQAEREAAAAASDISIADLLFGGATTLEEEGRLARDGDEGDEEDEGEEEAAADDEGDEDDSDLDDDEEGSGSDDEEGDDEEKSAEKKDGDDDKEGGQGTPEDF